MGDLESGGPALFALQLLLGSDRDPCANLSAAATTPASCGCTGARMRAMVGWRRKRFASSCWDRLGKPSPFGGLRHVLVNARSPSPLIGTYFLLLFNIQRFCWYAYCSRNKSRVSILDIRPLIAALSRAFTLRCTRVPYSSNKSCYRDAVSDSSAYAGGLRQVADPTKTPCYPCIPQLP
jgi:hypothetical protein